MENRNEALREIIEHEQDGHAAGQKGGLQTGKTNHQKEEIRFWMLRIQRNHDGAGSRGETGQRPERRRSARRVRAILEDIQHSLHWGLPFFYRVVNKMVKVQFIRITNLEGSTGKL